MLKKHFGADVKKESGTFEHTGITHVQGPDGVIRLYQRKYADSLQLIPTPELKHKPKEEKLDSIMHS
eukprot:3039947-Amphidinium_carterae.1